MGHIQQKTVRAIMRQFNLVHLGLACALACSLTACHSASPVDTAPLDHAGMSYDAIQQAKAARCHPPEVASLARARQSGLSDATCVTLLQMSRRRGQSFGERRHRPPVWPRRGLSEETIVGLAMELNQLGFRSRRASGDAPRRSSPMKSSWRSRGAALRVNLFWPAPLLQTTSKTPVCARRPCHTSWP